MFKDPTDNLISKNGLATNNENTRVGLGRGLLGRGRGNLGRGGELRKPGDTPRFHQTHIESTSQSSQNKLNEIEKMYAGPIAAPHPSAAPQPPASWIA